MSQIHLSNSASAADAEAVVRLRDVSKRFGHTTALNHVTFDIPPATIVGLMGGNGAGKSTLMRILVGVHEVSGGTLVVGGVERSAQNYGVGIARELGISGVFQELSLASNLRVYENFYLDNPRGSTYGGPGWRRRALSQVEALIDEVFPDSRIHARDPVDRLSLAQRQMVEIVRAAQDPRLKLLILDEPTSSLTQDRVVQLHQFVRRLKSERGVAVIYISHKLGEVLQLVDELVVLRNGSKVWEGAVGGVSADELVRVMAGGGVEAGEAADPEHSRRRARRASESVGAAPVVKLEDYTSSRLHRVTVQAEAGEIVGISGLEGNGQQDLLKAVFYRQRPRSGRLSVPAKVAYVSGNRVAEGIFGYWTIEDNIAVSSYYRLSRWGLIQRDKVKDLARHWFSALKFRARGINDDITSLSGGNQQKALIARALGSDAQVILLDDPTRGVDVETKLEIYRLIAQAADEGRAVIWFSTEDKEMEYCDRVYVLNQGYAVRELAGDEVSESEVVASAYIQPQGADPGGAALLEREPARRALSGLVAQRWFLPVLSFVGLMVAIGLINPAAMSSFGLGLLFEAAVPLSLAALSQMFIILAGDIDLGLGAFMGLVNVVCATTLVNKPLEGWLVLLLLVACYGVMGWIIHVRRLPAIVVTLGASFIWLGVALTLQSTPGGSVPGWLNNFFNVSFVVPIPILVMAVFAAVAYVVLRRTKYGVVLRAFGNNPGVIRRAGWSTVRARVTLYLLAGATAALAGLAVTVVNSGSDANASSAYTLLSIASVILGGSEFLGGIVEPVGVVIGALSFSLIGSLIGLVNITSNLVSGIEGLLLVLVLASRVLSSKGVRAS